jgi:hypothetical protein
MFSEYNYHRLKQTSDPKGKNNNIGGVGRKLSFGLRPVERLERKE